MIYFSTDSALVDIISHLKVVGRRRQRCHDGARRSKKFKIARQSRVCRRTQTRANRPWSCTPSTITLGADARLEEAGACPRGCSHSPFRSIGAARSPAHAAWLALSCIYFTFYSFKRVSVKLICCEFVSIITK